MMSHRLILSIPASLGALMGEKILSYAKRRNGVYS